VATAFPHARVELWGMGATDEHRIGLKPLLRRVWAPRGHRPIARVRHRFTWRYLVGFVHPASGRTIFHLATSVSIALFEGRARGVRPCGGRRPAQADRSRLGSRRLAHQRAPARACACLRVPEHLHLLFLPPYSPELQPAEHLWPLTNTCLINRQFATIEDLEDTQFAHCAQLQQHLDVIRSTTCFHWWPRHIHQRRGPRKR
jgi:transposase